MLVNGVRIQGVLRDQSEKTNTTANEQGESRNNGKIMEN